MRSPLTSLALRRALGTMAQANQVRKGNWVEIEGSILNVRKTAVTRSGKGGGFAVLTLKDVQTGVITTRRFRSDEKLALNEMEKARPTLVLYREGDNFVCCDDENFEQLELPLAEFGDDGGGAKFIVEGTTKVDVTYHNGVPFSVELPRSVEMDVTSTPPKKKSENDKKIATCTIGGGKETIEVRVPQYVEDGDRIGVCPETAAFLERL